MNAHVFEWSLRTALMAAGTGLVLRLLRVKSPSARHRAWMAVVVLMALLPAWTAWGPRVSAPVLPAATTTVEFPVTETGPGTRAVRSETPRAATTDAPAAQLPVTTQTAMHVPAAPQTAWRWDWIAFGCYLAVAMFMLARLIAGTIRAGLLVRRAVLSDGVLASPDCAVPVTVGWFRPAILLPASWREWPPEKLEAVLTHEREHVRRRDPLAQWIALLNRAIFWFHPLSWWLERRLSALAEDACDAAVLRRGHDPSRYSEYLIDMARDVQRAGGSIPVWGTAMASGTLRGRIQRILQGRPEPQMSRTRAVIAAALCAGVLAAFAACSIGERAQKAAPGQLTMNEMEKRSAAERMRKAAEEQALLDEAKGMTPEQASAKVAALKANPQDSRSHYQLMRYYEFHSDWKGKHALILWYIEHEPGGDVRPWNIPPWDRASYEQGKRLWLANIKKQGASAEIYDRAAVYLQGADKPLAEEILLAGRKTFPDDTRWGRLLGEHYAMALLGSTEPRTEYNVIRSISVAEAQGSYARSVRAKLEQSNDSRMLAQTAQWLTIWGRDGGRLSADTLALAESYASRAVTLDPTSEPAQSIRFRVQQMKEMEKLLDLRKLPTEEQKRLGDADRLLLLRSEMDQAWSPAGKNPKLDLAEAKAHELLDLAQRVPDAPHSGYSVFLANITLGKVALRKGDKREAARYLLAAADAPASEELRRGLILMNLPRTLIDWGEREAAAQFLERIAPKTLRAKEFQDWAAQIRKGVNPEVRPNMVGCGQEPC